MSGVSCVSVIDVRCSYKLLDRKTVDLVIFVLRFGLEVLAIKSFIN